MVVCDSNHYVGPVVYASREEAMSGEKVAEGMTREEGRRKKELVIIPESGGRVENPHRV